MPSVKAEDQKKKKKKKKLPAYVTVLLESLTALLEYLNLFSSCLYFYHIVQYAHTVSYATGNIYGCLAHASYAPGTVMNIEIYL